MLKSNNKTLDSNKHLILIMYKMVLQINEKDNLQEKWAKNTCANGQ